MAKIDTNTTTNPVNRGSKLVGFTGILAAAFIGTGLWLGLRGGASDAPRRIAVSGECLSSVAQDMTAVTLRFVAINENPAVSMNMARSAYEGLSARIRGITDDTMKMNTKRFDSYEKTEWNPTENRSVTLGTETTIELEVSSENRNTIEDVIAMAGGNSLTLVQGLRMYTSNKTMKPALEACIKTAVENARDKATAIASADGRTIGKMASAQYARTVSANGGIRPLMKTEMYNVASFDLGTGGTELFSSDSEISVTVDVEFDVR